MATISGNLADGKPMEYGGWYNARQWDGSKLGDPGVEIIGPNAGKAVSNAVASQTNPANVSYIEQQREINATDLQPSVSVPYSSGSNGQFVSGLTQEVQIARSKLDKMITDKKTSIDSEIAHLREKESQTVAKIGELTTPFREELEAKERERLYINKNFEDNQKLVDELDTLLTEGNDLIKQQKEVTGLSAVRNPRIQKAMDDVTARAGVIQSVINARNGQIAQAYTMIDRTSSSIAADRQDRISYYETILSLTNRDIISLDADSKNLAQEQINLAKSDLNNAQKTVDYVKELLLNPATAQLMAQGGVKLTDNVETINQKLATASYSQEVQTMSNEMSKGGYTSVFDPKTVPAGQLITMTDSKGKKYYFKKAAAPGDSVVSAEKFIREQLNKSSSSDTAGISTDKYSILLDEVNSVIAPNFAPAAGIGSRYTDSYGQQWVYESKGWRLVG
jgi:hypothetical protein